MSSADLPQPREIYRNSQNAPFPREGVHFGISESEYHGHAGERVVSKSKLCHFARSAYKFKHGPEPDFSKNYNVIFGSVVDCLLLTPDAFDSDYIVAPFTDWRTKAAKAWKEDHKKDNREVISEEVNETAKACVKAIRAHKIAGPLCDPFGNVETQVSCVLHGAEPETGLAFELKSRIDVLPHIGSHYGEWIFDLKTTDSIERFDRIMANLHYHAGAAIYLDLWNVLCHPDDRRRKFGFIVAEREPPFEVAVLECDPIDIEAGRRAYEGWLHEYAKCVASGEWPSKYADSVGMVSRPKWARFLDQ